MYDMIAPLCVCTSKTPPIVNFAGVATIELLFQTYSGVWLLTSLIVAGRSGVNSHASVEIFKDSYFYLVHEKS